MSATRRSQYERLLRWYPPSWRQTNGQLMLDTIEEHADASGRTRPSRAEAWSLRAHGLAERATVPEIIVVASTALALSLSTVVVLWFGGVARGPWAQGAFFGAQFLGDLLVSIAAGALILRKGFISAEQALFSGAIAIPAWVFGGLAAASWSVGFDEADAGGVSSWFGGATIFFIGAAVLLGAIALMPLYLTVFRTLSTSSWRWTLSVVIAGVSSLFIGISAVVQSTTLLAAATILLLAGLQLRKPRERSAVPPQPRQPLDRNSRRQLAVVTGAAALLGICCVAFALTGSNWAAGSPDATQAMRLGILLGALAATLVVAASAILLFARLGTIGAWSGAVLIAALLVLALSYAMNIDDPTSWALMVIAGILTGLAFGILFLPVLPNRPWLKALLVVAISLALAGTLGMIVALAAAFVSPIVAIVLTVVLVRQPRARSGELRPLHAS